jgi:hypothetical protein
MYSMYESIVHIVNFLGSNLWISLALILKLINHVKFVHVKLKMLET